MQQGKEARKGQKGNEIGICFLLCLCLLNFPFIPCTEALASFLGFNETGEQILLRLVDLLFYGAALFLPAFLLRKSGQPPLSLVPSKLHFAQWIDGIFTGLGIAFLASFVHGIFWEILQEAGLPFSQRGFVLPQNFLEGWLFILRILILPAIGEELLFRGYFFKSLRFYGKGFGILASSVLFMLFHMQVAQFFSALVMGLYLGYLAQKTGSLLPGMILHLLNNALVILTLYWPSPVWLPLVGSLIGIVGIVRLLLREKRTRWEFGVPKIFWKSPWLWLGIGYSLWKTIPGGI